MQSLRVRPTRMGACHSADSRRSEMGSPVVAKSSANVEQLRGARKEVEKLIRDKDAGPIIIRLGWHDSGTYNKNIATWPERGGAIGSIRFDPESGHGANKGLGFALDLLKPVKEQFPDVSYADIFQMASATAIEVAGGPKVPMRYGRRDARDHKDCAVEGNLPDAGAPFKDGSKSPGDHLRKVFYRMGLNDGEIVALSGAHTLGRSHKDRSGWAVEKTAYTTKDSGKWTGGKSAEGGQSWTANWLVFDNSYFTEVKQKRDSELLVLPTDGVIFEDEAFRPFAEKYAASQEVFFADYAAAHAKLSELGVEWVENAPVTI